MNIIDYIETRGLTKVAKTITQSGTELTLKPNPSGYGIHSKREGVSHRGLAVTHNVPAAIAAGLPLGALGGALTEGANTNVLTAKGRKKIKAGYASDAKALGQGVSEDYLRKAIENPRSEIAKYLASKVSPPMDPNAAKLVKNIQGVAKRRMGIAGKGILSGMAAAGGLKSMVNLGQYEASRALAPHERKFLQAKKKMKRNK